MKNTFTCMPPIILDLFFGKTEKITALLCALFTKKYQKERMVIDQGNNDIQILQRSLHNVFTRHFLRSRTWLVRLKVGILAVKHYVINSEMVFDVDSHESRSSNVTHGCFRSHESGGIRA